MKTIGELGLKVGDRVKRPDGTGGTAVDVFGAGKAVWVHWDYQPEAHRYDVSESVAWEVVPKPVPTVASLGLKVGDVVRWGGRNYLVESFGSESVMLLDSGGCLNCVKIADPIPENFRKVVTE